MAFTGAIIVLVLDAGGVWRLVRLTNRLRHRPGLRLATILSVVGVCITIGQVALVIAFGLVLSDPDRTLDTRVILVGAAQFVVAGGILWAARAAERL